jgi:L-lactate utilization protein LutB
MTTSVFPGSILGPFAQRGIVTHAASNSREALELCLGLIDGEEPVSWSGSMTVEAIGLQQAVEAKGIRVLSRLAEGSPEERWIAARNTLSAATYFTSANAITYDGRLVSIDGFGNRVAAQIFGPGRVVFVAGVNKLVGTLGEAIYRVRNIATPANVRRLHGTAPCGELDHCVDCITPGRICCDLAVIEYVRVPGRVHLVLVNERLGF